MHRGVRPVFRQRFAVHFIDYWFERENGGSRRQIFLHAWLLADCQSVKSQIFEWSDQSVPLKAAASCAHSNRFARFGKGGEGGDPRSLLYEALLLSGGEGRGRGGPSLDWTPGSWSRPLPTPRLVVSFHYLENRLF